MPVRKGTLERSLGRKVLDGAKYVGKASLLSVSSICGIYIGMGIVYHEWNPLKWKEAKQHKKEINSSYNQLFENAKNLGDTLEIANKYNIPYELTLKPSQKDKERAVLKGKLE